MNMFDVLYNSVVSDETSRLAFSELLATKEPYELISPGIRDHINSILVKPITHQMKEEMQRREALQYERGIEQGKNAAHLEAYDEMEAKKEKEISELKRRIAELESK